jgi:type IV secretory pathway component VirB8
MKKERKYFEFMGDTISNNKFLHFAVSFLLIILILQTVVIIKLLKRDPIVIKVDQLGNTGVYSLKNNQSLSSYEINNFTQHFLGYFLKYNVYTQVDNFTRAFEMVTEECSQEFNKYLTTNNIEEYITKNQIKTELNISNISVVEDGIDYIRLKVRGTREETSYTDTTFYKEIIFEDILVLQKIPRSTTNPWGLVVANWEEKVFKK